MSYTALYRKFRPDDFNEVKGQDHIVTVLKNQVISERVGHAYLFCGTRGTGKTSVAKVLAKAVNCEHPVNGNPCNECETCKAIKAGTSMNVVEIDAASNNGVENIRDIIEEVRYAPTEGRYRVYIIDEVHMLSVSAFNALLKTLEEPPSYVVFILATTEAHKIPVTIMSRCQRYDFKRISNEMIKEHLEAICKAENTEAEDKALRYIAGKADGAFRDAISLLDQCISFCFGEKLTYDRVLDILGAVDIEIFAKLLRCISGGRVADSLEVLQSVINNGRDIAQFITDFIWYMRNLLIVGASEEETEIFDISAEQMKMLRHEAQVYDATTLMRNIKVFSELSNVIRHATQKRVLTEIALIRACMPQVSTDDDSVLERIRHIEDTIENGAVFTKAEETETESEPVEEILPDALPEDLRQVAANWKMIISDDTLPALARVMLVNAVPTVKDDKLLLLLSSVTDEKVIESEKDNIAKAIMHRIGKNVTFTSEVRAVEKNTRKLIDISQIVKIEVENQD